MKLRNIKSAHKFFKNSEDLKPGKKNQSNRVIVVGAGQVGTHIMGRLAAEGYDVVLIDEDEDMVNKSREVADVGCIVGNGCNPQIYSDIGLNSKDLFLAVTDSDETNLVACHIAQAFGCETKIARVRQPFYKSDNETPLNDEFWKKMGVEILFNQDLLTIQEIEHLMENPGAIDTVFLHGGRDRIVAYKVKPHSLMIGRRLIGLRDVPIFENLLVVAVNTVTDINTKTSISNRLKEHFSTGKKSKKEGLKTHMLIPRGDYKIKEGDLLYLAGVRKDFLGIGHLFDPGLIKEFTRVFILGGSILSHQLSQYILQHYPGKSIYLIEQTKKEAYLASESLDPRINVLLTSSHDIETLIQEGLDKYSIFIGASNEEDDNVLTCLLAKEETQARTITIVHSNVYSHLIQYLEIDATVSPKSLLVEDVLKVLRKNVYDVLSAKEHDAEILEFVVPEKSIMAGQRLRDFRFPENSIVAFIYRGESIIIPRGDSVIHCGDHMVIFSLRSAIEEVQNIFLN
ncbi:MAG: NAD-binding protein [Leptospirales bacterium]